MSESTARLTALARETREALHSDAGKTDAAVRASIEAHVAGQATDLDPKLITLVDEVRSNPAKADLETLLADGYTDDDIFEIVLVAATAEGMLRLDAGLAAMGADGDAGDPT